MATEVISSFRGGYGFLSNFWTENLTMRGVVYLSGEHAFQAAKALVSQEHDWVAAAPTPKNAKWRGRRVAKRPDWDQIRVEEMRAVVRAKFPPGSQLAARLDATGDAILVEGNRWGDVFWGVCAGVGENWLGRILMEVRADNRRLAA